MNQVSGWSKTGKATWTVDVAEARAYYLDLKYKGEERPVWKITTDEGAMIQNQQAATPVYHSYPFGMLEFKKPGRHTITVSLVDGDPEKSSLAGIRVRPAE